MSLALTPQEQKNKRIAAGVSIAVHALILLFLIYMLAWQAPDPPAQEYGIELNFGMDAVGSGDIQTKAIANDSKNTEDSKPAPTQPDPLPEPQPVAQPTPPSQPVETPKVTTTTADAPVSAKEAVKPQPKPQPTKEESKKPVKETTKEVIKKEPEKPRSLYPGAPTNTSGTGKSGTSDKATGNNNGDDKGKVGDKGDPEGKVDSKALYGKSGGGSDGLDMPGWRFDIKPKKDPYTNESGIVRFRIKVDADGNVTSADVIESTVSPHVVNWYKDELFTKASLVRTGGGSAGASGVVTFVIRSR